MSETEHDLQKITRHHFYFEAPLYKEFKNTDLAENAVRGNVDGINPYKGYDTTYDIVSRHLEDYVGYNYYSGGMGPSRSVSSDSESRHYYFIKLKCRRNASDCLYYFIYHDDEKTIKLGQNPSLADIQLNELDKKYKRVLDKDNLFLLKRAIGLAAHGTGAGSLVYLRRIFEGLISQSYKRHRNDIPLSETDFAKKRMNEKVECLEDYLPTELTEMKPLYGVLSQGVHELTEEECLSYFPALKLSIELILDRKIEEEARSKHANNVKAQLQAIQSKIGKKISKSL